MSRVPPHLLAIVIVLCRLSRRLKGCAWSRVVNDDAVTDFDLSPKGMFAIRTTGLQDSPELRQRMAAQILRQMIDERLQIQDAKRLGLKASDAELQQRFSDIERSAGMVHGQFRQYLQSVGVPFEIAIQQIEAQIAWNKIIRRKVEGPRSTFRKPRSTTRWAGCGRTSARPNRAWPRSSCLSTAPTFADEAKRSADRITEQLKRGAPFGAVAQQFSKGRPRRQAVNLGGSCPGRSIASLDAAVEKLPVKQYSEPIRSSAGWHIPVRHRPPAVRGDAAPKTCAST